MTLVERYLRAVRDFLPRGQQDDIINELSDNIQSRDRGRGGSPRPATRRGRASLDPALHGPSHGCRRTLSGRPAHGDVRLAADRPEPSRSTSRFCGSTSRSRSPGGGIARRRQFDLVGRRRRRRPVRPPVRDRHRRLHRRRPPLAPRSRRLGPSQGQFHGRGRRHLEPRRDRHPVDRPRTSHRCASDDVAAGDRPAGRRPDILAGHRTSRRRSGS